MRRALILLYHRVTELRSDPWALSVTPQHFAQHLEILRQRGLATSLRQLAQALLDGNLPHRSVAITFDDGYADNLHNAKPVLERYDVPATCFLTTGSIGRAREFWWDELDRIFLQPNTLPETLRLSIRGHSYHWVLGEATEYDEDTARRCRAWCAFERGDPTLRHFVYRSLYELLQPLTEDEQRAVLDELLAWARTDPTSRQTHRTLSIDDAQALAEGELIEIGAHTVTHPLLSTLPPASQHAEVTRSKAHLEEMLGIGVKSFAYPYGGPATYTAATVTLVREAGFTYACSGIAKPVAPSSRQFELPRVVVPDWDGEQFAEWLSRWFRA